MTFLSYSCRNCGANIDVQPDNLLTICAYCGDVHAARDISDLPVHIVPSWGKQHVTAALQQRMANDPDMRGVSYEIQSVEGVYVPLYINFVEVQGGWQGTAREFQGNRTANVPKGGYINHRGDFPVLARKHAHEFGLAQLGPLISHAQPVPFRSVAWKDVALPVLSVDVTEGEADATVADDVIDLLGEQIREQNGLTSITAFDATARVQSRFILLFPLWTAIYVYAGGSYRVAIEGSRPSVLAAMEPVFQGQRIRRFFATLGATLGAGLVWFFGWPMLASGGRDGEVALVFIAMLLATIGTAWFMAGRMVASVNVEGIEDETLKGQLTKHPWVKRYLRGLLP